MYEENERKLETFHPLLFSFQLWLINLRGVGTQTGPKSKQETAD